MSTNSSSEKLTRKEAELAALRVIGSLFTEEAIKRSNNPKIAGFSQNAESCLTDVIARRNSIFWFNIWIALGSLYAFLGYHIDTTLRWLGVGVTVGFYILACLQWWVNLKNDWDQVGTTARAVAKEWKPVREVCIRHKIMSDVAGMIQHHKNLIGLVENYEYNHIELQSWVVFYLDQALTRSADKVKTAEREGKDSVRRKARIAFAEVHAVSQKLGLPTKSWGEYFGEEK